MKRVIGKPHVPKAFAALVVCLGLILTTLGTGLFVSATDTTHQKLDLSYLLGENVDTSAWTAAERAAWDEETGDAVIKVKSIYADTALSTKAALIDGYKQGGLDVANGSSYVSSGEAADLNVDESITLNLQKPYTVNQVSFTPSMYEAWYNGFPVDFTVEVSTNGDNWKTVVEKTDFSFTLGQVDYLLPFEAEENVQYIRFNCSKIILAWNGTLNSLALQEIEVYEPSSNETPGTPGGDEGQAAGEIQVLDDGRLDFTPLFNGAKDEQLVGWDAEEKYISTSHSFETVDKGRYAGKAFLVDGDRTKGDDTGNYYASCTNDPDQGMIDVNHDREVDEWILFDLQKNYDLNRFQFSSLFSIANFGMPEDFKVEVSQDGDSWKTVVVEKGLTFSYGTANYTFSFDPVSARYVRFSVSKIADSYGASLDGQGNHLDPRGYSLILTEIELYAESAAEETGIKVLENGKLDFTPLFKGATGKELVGWDEAEDYISVSHSLEAAWDPPVGKAFLVDGSIAGGSGYWASCSLVPDTTNLTDLNKTAEVDEWVYFNLQEKFNIGKFVFAPRYADKNIGMPEDFKLEVSEDGIIWKTVIDETGYKATKGTCEFAFEPGPTQYMRFSVTKVAAADPTLQYSLQLSEMQFYETDGAPLPPTSAETVYPVVVACLFAVSLITCGVIKSRKKIRVK